jgi:hypothetical protein
VVLEECGHVPQVEHPKDANGLIAHFIAAAPASARERAAAHIARAAKRIRPARINGNGHPAVRRRAA